MERVIPELRMKTGISIPQTHRELRDGSSGYESDVDGPARPVPVTSSRRRRSRTLFSVADLDKLESAFRLERYPGIYEREKLAAELGVTEDRIQVWFQNRRSKLKKRVLRRPPPLRLPPPHFPLGPVHTSPPGLDVFSPPYVITPGSGSERTPPHTTIANNATAKDSKFVPRRPWETPSPPRPLPEPRLGMLPPCCLATLCPPLPPPPGLLAVSVKPGDRSYDDSGVLSRGVMLYALPDNLRTEYYARHSTTC